MSSIRVAIVGVGNCAASLVQGVEYYKNADPKQSVPGLMHVQFGEYHVKDVQFVAAFDVDAKKLVKIYQKRFSQVRTTPSSYVMFLHQELSFNVVKHLMDLASTIE